MKVNLKIQRYYILLNVDVTIDVGLQQHVFLVYNKNIKLQNKIHIYPAIAMFGCWPTCETTNIVKIPIASSSPYKVILLLSCTHLVLVNMSQQLCDVLAKKMTEIPDISHQTTQGSRSTVLKKTLFFFCRALLIPLASSSVWTPTSTSCTVLSGMCLAQYVYEHVYEPPIIFKSYEVNK